MKTKNTMTKRFFHQYNELDAVAEFLEKQEAAGWELTDISGSTYGFRRCRPRKVKINVEIVYPEYDCPERQEYMELCRAEGWEHLYDDGDVQYFRHRNLRAEPIHTEPKVKLDIVHDKCVETQLYAPLAVGVLCFIWWIYTKYFLEYGDYLENKTFVVLYGMPLMVALLLGQAITYLSWHRKAKADVERGQWPVYKRSFFSRFCSFAGIAYFLLLTWGTIFLNLFYIGNAVWMVFFTVAFAAVIAYLIFGNQYAAAKNKDRKRFFDVRRTAAGVILILVIFFSGKLILGDGSKVIDYEDLSLTLPDLGIETEEGRKDDGAKYDRAKYEGSRYGTFMLQREYGRDETKNEKNYQLYYEVHRAANRKVFDEVMEKRYSYVTEPECYYSLGNGVDIKRKFEEVTDPVFTADKIYYANTVIKTWLLIYGNDVIEVETDFPLTDEQKRIVEEKLTAS